MRWIASFLLLMMPVAAGCSGDDGPAGPAGNANVMSGSVTPTNAEWLWPGGYTQYWGSGSWTSYFTRYYDIALTELSADLIDNGAVLVYMEPVPDSGRWVPLDHDFVSFDAAYTMRYVYEASEGLIRLQYFMTPNQGAVPSAQTYVLADLAFRYVLIAGKALQTMQAGGVDVGNYEQVVSWAKEQGSDYADVVMPAR